MTCIILGYAHTHLNSSEIRLSSLGSRYVDIESWIERRLSWTLPTRSRIDCGPGLDSTFGSFCGLHISLLNSHGLGLCGLSLLGLVLADPWPNNNQVFGDDVVSTPLISRDIPWYFVTLKGISVGDKYLPYDSSGIVSKGNVFSRFRNSKNAAATWSLHPLGGGSEEANSVGFDCGRSWTALLWKWRGSRQTNLDHPFWRWRRGANAHAHLHSNTRWVFMFCHSCF